MGNTLEHFCCGLQRTRKAEHSAFKVFVILKNIFRHLPDSELLVARLVNRIWNFTAISELVSRQRHLSTIKLYSFTSNQFRDRDYNWYLDFENTRRSIWNGIYGDCAMIEFRHLHFSYPENTPAFLKIIQSPWLSSVTSLTLSMYSEISEEIVINWFLPALPNLQNISCFIKPQVEIQSAFSDLSELYPAHSIDRNTTRLASAGSLVPMAVELDRRVFSKLHSISICFEEACSFPFTLLDFFPGLQDLKLEFQSITTFVESVEKFAPMVSTREIDNLHIALTRKPNLQEQIDEAELNAEALVTANVKLCNLFRIRQSLNVVSMIPAVQFFEFLTEVTATEPKQIKFEIAIPRYVVDDEEYLNEFLTYLVGEILIKFPELSCLHLQYLEQRSKTVFPTQDFLAGHNLNSLDHLQSKVKQLHFSTIPAEIEPIIEDEMYFRALELFCQLRTLFVMAPWFQGVVELVIQVHIGMDCSNVLYTVGFWLKGVKKIVLQGPHDVVKLQTRPEYFFPEVDRPNFPNDKRICPEYEGLPAIQSLEVLRMEKLGVYFHPLVIPEICKMRRLKSIQLDADFNSVTTAENPRFKSLVEQLTREGKISPTWPSSIEHVQITNT